ncbi:NfeD family protein [Fibrella forsythiae]|uniref:NfeD family protein n=1 Tax=Fibrella forsythiae TaxID=2817061 RepID=A0ABS3JDJ5_9BACT|nr:NfeD family protein [Fibrella forsythiae]MBO0948068.1 NfeD family protein [Fibrella forsythiae]
MTTIFTLPPPINWTDLDTALRTVDLTALTDTCRLGNAGQSVMTLFLSVPGIHSTPPNETPLLAGSGLFLWRWMRRWLTCSTHQADCVGDSVKVTQTIPVHGLGRVNYRGTEWSARTLAGKTHKPGDGVTIRRVEGIILVVD